jgi:myo-inositol-1(or 4)-monophosphatase
MTPAALCAIATEGARRAGQLLKERFEGARTIDYKGEGRSNLVTDADRASEALLLSWVRAQAPGHAIVAEESGAHDGDAHVWFIDPLDGTTNYAHRVPHFCVTLGVEGPLPEGGRGLLAGVVFDPMRGELFSAARGQGAFLNGQRLTASTEGALDRALLCTGFPYDVQQAPTAPLGLFDRLVRRAQGMRRMGSAALDLAYVAAGRFDGYFEFGLKPWDLAAGALLVDEAGACFTRIDGAPVDVRYGDVLACARPLAPTLQPLCASFVRDIGWAPRRFGER